MQSSDEAAAKLMSDWQAAALFIEADGVRMHHRIEGEGPWLVCFHGFPTTAWDWHALVPLLSKHRRVLTFDFPGYGLSEKPVGRDYSLLRQLDATESLLRKLGIVEFDLVAHDMGNSVACELLHRIEEGATTLKPRTLTLMNGGIYMDLHQPILTQRLLRTPILGEFTARLSSWRIFLHQYPKVHARPGQFDEAHYRHQWNLILHNSGRRTLAKVAGYMRERVRRGERWLGPLHRTTLPLTLIWGRRDPVAVHAIAERVCANNPRAKLISLDDAGHYPQLEDPPTAARHLLAARRPGALVTYYVTSDSGTLTGVNVS